MGKLHTLKRAIQRNPKAFMSEGPLFVSISQEEPRLAGIRAFATGAEFRDGQWQPATVSTARALLPYRRFVKASLRELGYDALA